MEKTVHAEQKIQDPGPHAKKYGAYQNQVYGAGMLHNIRPTVTKDPNKLEEQAKKEMTAKAYSYVGGGAGERATMDANRLAFRQWKMIPRMLRPTTTRDLSVTLFGKTYDSPCLASPIGVQALFHADGEKGVAEIMGEIGIPYICSTASSHTLEEVAEANDKGAKTAGSKADRWFQLYWPQTENVTESLLSRAKAAGYSVLVVTLDTWALAWRPWDLDLAYVPFFAGLGCAIGFSDPAFRANHHAATGKAVEDDITAASQAWIGDVFSGAAHSWEQLAHVRAHWDGPILLKGIQHADDALKAHECGMDGVIVSNHGGRQMDGAIGSLDMLPEIAAAVRGKKSARNAEHDFAVVFDSGIRTGVDVIKAMCLGAHAVGIGRPWVYGLGIAGKAGAKEVMKGLLADLDQSMGLGGMQSVQDCTKNMVRKVEYPGDRNSNN